MEKLLSIKLVFSAITDTTDDPDNLHASERISALLQKYPEGKVEYTASDTEHGIGAGWQTITLEVLSTASTVFLGVPMLRKKVKEAVEGWKDIKADIDRFLKWLNSHERIASYSVEVAFLEALQHLDRTGQVTVAELELFDLTVIPGKTSAESAEFDNTDLFYYLFVFRENQDRAYILLYNSELALLSLKAISLDTRSFIGAEVPNIEE